MASDLTYFFNFILLSTFSIIINGQNSYWHTEMKPMHQMKEKVSHLHFYFHDTVSGKNPTVIRIAGPKDTGFGTTRVADDPLTEGPDPKSKLIGKAQGMFAVSAQQELSLIMMLSYAFTAGKYNGSTLSILGRNSILHPIREMPIVGGTGLFRFARGYALARTVSFDTTLEDAVVEYNVTVIHY